jgi:hypothetical protein
MDKWGYELRPVPAEAVQYPWAGMRPVDFAALGREPSFPLESVSRMEGLRG